MQAPPQVAGINLLSAIYLLLVVMAIVLPMLSRPWAPPEHEDPDSGGGPDDGPPDAPPPPAGPSDGLPLPDAEPSGVRLRGPGRIADSARLPGRRPAHPPERPAAPARPPAP